MTYYDNLENYGRKGYGIVFNKNKQKNIEEFRKIDWSKVAFLSTNLAYNIRTSQIKIYLFKLSYFIGYNIFMIQNDSLAVYNFVGWNGMTVLLVQQSSRRQLEKSI